MERPKPQRKESTQWDPKRKVDNPNKTGPLMDPLKLGKGKGSIPYSPQWK